jgi:hypothetical protein
MALSVIWRCRRASAFFFAFLITIVEKPLYLLLLLSRFWTRMLYRRLVVAEVDAGEGGTRNLAAFKVLGLVKVWDSTVAAGSDLALLPPVRLNN